MSFWKKLLGLAGATGGEALPGRVYREKDNRGTRQETFQHAAAYWMSRNASQNFVPYVIYEFGSGNDARTALLALEVMHEASDSKKLICTETLIYGCYPRHDGVYEAIVCGADLSHDLWQKAKESFSRHGGKRKNDQEPDKSSTARVPNVVGDSRKVKFLRQENNQNKVYRIHAAPDAASAKAFLEQNPVSKQFLYLVVETPEGNYCRDIDGMYKE